MTTQICIDAPTGQDCLEFSRIGEGPSKNWHLDHVHSKSKMNSLNESHIDPPINSENQGLFYVNMSAHGQMV